MSRLLISIHGSSLHFFMFMSLNKNSYFSSNMYYTFLVRIIFIFRFLLLLRYILQYFMISWHLGNLLIFNIDLIFSHLTEIIISYDNVSIVFDFSQQTLYYPQMMTHAPPMVQILLFLHIFLIELVTTFSIIQNS